MMIIIGVKIDYFIFICMLEGDLYYGYGEVGIYVLGQSQWWMLEVEIDVLDKNNCLVVCNCVCFVVKQQLVLNLVFSFGFGKIILFIEIFIWLKGCVDCVVIEGDQ